MVIIQCYNLENNRLEYKKEEYSLNRLDKVVVKVVNNRKKYGRYSRVIVSDTIHAVVIEEN